MLSPRTRSRQKLRHLSRPLLVTLLIGQALYGVVAFLGQFGMSIKGSEFRTMSAGSKIVTDMVNSGQLVLPNEEFAESPWVRRIADAAQEEAALYGMPAVRSALLMVGLGVASLVLLRLQQDKPVADAAPDA